MSGNEWKRGLERIAPGLYVDKDGAMHIDEDELLAAHGYAKNEHNSRMIHEAAARIAQEQGIKLTDRTEYVCAHCGAAVSDPAKHSC